MGYTCAVMATNVEHTQNLPEYTPGFVPTYPNDSCDINSSICMDDWILTFFLLKIKANSNNQDTNTLCENYPALQFTISHL